MKFSRTIKSVLIATSVLGVSGCNSSKPTQRISTCRVPTDSPQAGDILWDAVLDTLREHRFKLDRVERRTGLATTLPTTSKQFFEFWRQDVATTHDAWESTLNPIRRWVKVTFESDQSLANKRLSVEVHKQRFSSPDRQFNSSGGAYEFFGASLPSTTGIARITAAHNRWIDMGRDPAMEDYLLRKILNRAGIDMPDAEGAKESS